MSKAHYTGTLGNWPGICQQIMVIQINPFTVTKHAVPSGCLGSYIINHKPLLTEDHLDPTWPRKSGIHTPKYLTWHS